MSDTLCFIRGFGAGWVACLVVTYWIVRTEVKAIHRLYADPDFRKAMADSPDPEDRLEGDA